jgi:thioredoxin-dependent peroxiredoxin
VKRKGPSLTDNARLAPGDKAPAFALPDGDGKKVSLADYRGRRVIVYFYPAASTPGCTKQACFRDSLAELNEAGIDVVGISPDKPEKLAKFRDAEKLTFPLLSDPDRKVLPAWVAFGEKKMYEKPFRVCRPAYYIRRRGSSVDLHRRPRAARRSTRLLPA